MRGRFNKIAAAPGAARHWRRLLQLRPNLREDEAVRRQMRLEGLDPDRFKASGGARLYVERPGRDSLHSTSPGNASAENDRWVRDRTLLRSLAKDAFQRGRLDRRADVRSGIIYLNDGVDDPLQKPGDMRNSILRTIEGLGGRADGPTIATHARPKRKWPTLKGELAWARGRALVRSISEGGQPPVWMLTDAGRRMLRLDPIYIELLGALWRERRRHPELAFDKLFERVEPVPSPALIRQRRRRHKITR